MRLEKIKLTPITNNNKLKKNIDLYHQIGFLKMSSC